MADEPKRPGPVPQPKSVDLHFRLPAKMYDQLYDKASARYCTVPELIRELLRDRSRPEE